MYNLLRDVREVLSVLELWFGEKFINHKDLFQKIAALQNKIRWSEDIDFEILLSAKELLHDRICLFLLNSLVAFGAQYGKTVQFLIDDPIETTDFSYEPANCLLLDDEKYVELLVNENISQNSPIQMTDKLTEMLISLVGELYHNAREHSEASYTIGSCYKKIQDRTLKSLCFHCYDTGIGIVESVRRFLNMDDNSKFRDYKVCAKLLEWALKDGNTTKEPPRGVGISWLLEFAKINKGFFRICSESVLFEQNCFGDHTYQRLNHNFCGSFFEMHIVEDANALYKLKGE